MELVEVVIQGLKNATELGRIHFSSNLTILPAGPRQRLISRVVLDLLYPKGIEPTLVDLVLKEGPEGQSRVGVVVKGRDDNRYRLLQDAPTGRRVLQKIIGERAEPISQSPAEIAQAVTAVIGFPQEDIVREIFFAAREDLPSHQASMPMAQAMGSATQPPQRVSTNASGPASRPLPPGFSDEGAPDLAEADARARIEEIDGMLARYGATSDVEFELDGVQKKIFEVEARILPLQKLRANVDAADVLLQQFTDLEGLPADLVDKGAALLSIREHHAKDIERLRVDEEALHGRADAARVSLSPTPMFSVAMQDPLVKFGLIGGAVAIILGLVGAATASSLRWLALLDIPAFGAAVFGGIRVLGALELGESIRRRLTRVADEKKRLQQKLSADEQDVHNILASFKLTVDDLPEVQERLSHRADALSRVSAARTALADAEESGNAASIDAEHQELLARAGELESKLAASGVVGFSSQADLTAERSRLQAQLAGEPVEDRRRRPSDEAKTEHSLSTPPTFVEDRCQRLVTLAKDLFLTPLDDVTNQVRPRASRILTILADGRYTEMQFGTRGETSLIEAAAGQAMPFSTLPPLDRDIAWLSLKVAILEAVGKKSRTPIVFDRGLDILSDAKTPILQKMLQFLAQDVQVICITEKTSLGGGRA